jgi:hypothetical protein
MLYAIDLELTAHAASRCVSGKRRGTRRKRGKRCLVRDRTAALSVRVVGKIGSSAHAQHDSKQKQATVNFSPAFRYKPFPDFGYSTYWTVTDLKPKHRAHRAEMCSLFCLSHISLRARLEGTIRGLPMCAPDLPIV